MVQPLLIGRGVSLIRTPILIRDYLAGQGAFSDDPPEELAQRLADGAYVAHIHQRIKQYIRESAPMYQWPRRHSFHARINDLLMLGLLVETGHHAEPEHRGAGRLGTSRGFSERVWVRLAPDAFTRPEWADPLGYLIILKQKQDPSSYHNIRTPGRVLATDAPVSQAVPLAAPLVEPTTSALARRRPTPARAQPLTVPESLVESTESLRQLEAQRQTLQASAEFMAVNGATADAFEKLWGDVLEFNNQAVRALGGIPFPDLSEALYILRSCITVLGAARQMNQQRVQAIGHCRAGARLVAQAISPLLGVERDRPVAGPAPPVEGDIVRQAWDRLVESRPNSAFAERILDRLEAQSVDVGEARDALEKYTVITRSDYEGGKEGTEEYREARETAWQDFLDTLEQTEEPEEDEEPAA